MADEEVRVLHLKATYNTTGQSEEVKIPRPSEEKARRAFIILGQQNSRWYIDQAWIDPPPGQGEKIVLK
jgi:hypothetical protein